MVGDQNGMLSLRSAREIGDRSEERAQTSRGFGKAFLGLALGCALTVAPLSAATAVAPHPLPAVDEADDGSTAPQTAEVEPGDVETTDPAQAGTAPASAGSLPLGWSFPVASGQSYTASFAVPAGLAPDSFRATVSGERASAIRISSPGRVIAVVDPGEEEVEAPLDASDIDENGRLELTFAFTGGSEAWCAFEEALVRGAALSLVGEVETPESVADFFGAGARAATVELPSAADPALRAAGLNLVTAATAALGQASDVTLRVSGEQGAQQQGSDDLPPFAQRRVILSPTDGEVSTSIETGDDGIAVLTLAGGPEQLLAAAKAFSQQGIALASAAQTSGLAADPSTDPTRAETSLTLEQLGVDRLSLTGYGRQDGYVDVAQGAFGRTLGGLGIHLRGAVSSTDATIATVQLIWNDTLVDSFVVDPAEPIIDRTVEISGEQLRSGNGLTIRLQAVSANQACVSDGLLPQIRLDIDTATSTVAGVSGRGASAGFAEFPQAFTGATSTAFGEEATAAQLEAAGTLLAALQRATPRPMVVEEIAADDLIGGSGPGILIGATAEQTRALRAPLRLSETRLISDTAGELTVAVDQPFAALQAVRHGGRDLLVLAAYPGGEGADTDGVLTGAVGGLDGTGWWQLYDSVRLATPGKDPVLLQVNDIVPQEETKADYANVAWWALGGLVLLVAVGLIAAAARSRRKRAAREIVDAEAAMLDDERADASQTGEVEER